jgi:hypothetical protein
MRCERERDPGLVVGKKGKKRKIKGKKEKR